MKLAGKKVLFVDNPACDLHNPGTILPEKPFRTRVIREALVEEVHRDSAFDWVISELVPNMTFEVAWIHATRVHSKKYLKHLLHQLKFVEKHDNREFVSKNGEAIVSKGSMGAIVASIGSVIAATDAAHCDRKDEQKFRERIFCNIRPPGHHACVSEAMGFCMINNVAVAIEYAFTLNPKHRVFCIDWDNHHGNGSADFYRDRKNVHYLSLHGSWKENYPFKSGDPKDRGYHNNIINISLPIGSSHIEVVTAFEEQVVPELYTFDPTLIFISCGFDAHELDNVGVLKYSNETYRFMTEEIVKLANQSDHRPPIISLLEGGYNEQVLRECSIIHLRALAEI